MSEDVKFKQRWEFRRRDEDLDSSSEEKSSSGGEPVLKRHKLAPGLVLPENDETRATQSSHQEIQLNPHTDIAYESGKTNEMHDGQSRKPLLLTDNAKRRSLRRSIIRKSHRRMRKRKLLEDFKIFVEFKIEELKVARENMFAQMREELKKLVAVKLGPKPTRKKSNRMQKVGRRQHQKKVELGGETQNCNGGSLERSVKSDRTTDSNTSYQILEQQVNHHQLIGNVKSNEKEKEEKLGLSIKKPIYSSNLSDPLVSSPYLTIPTVWSEPLAKTDMSLERAKSLIDANARRGYFHSIQTEHLGSSSPNIGYFGQSSGQASTMGTGLPVSLQQRFLNSFNVPGCAPENSSRDNSILGLKVKGGAIRFSSTGHSLLEHLEPGNSRSQMNYNGDGLMVPGNQDSKDGHSYPN